MEVDYDAVNESIMESIMEDIGGMNIVDFVESLTGMDHAKAGIMMVMTHNVLDNSENSVNDFLEYLHEQYGTEVDSPYEEFVHIVTREVDRQFDERGR